MTQAVESMLAWLAAHMPSNWWLHEYHNVKALVAVTLVSLICGAAGTLVVGNRMAFFSDALAHCAFAGVTLGMLLALFVGSQTSEWLIPATMLSFGLGVGVLIAYVRERTGLESDTVIGVFFAGAVGVGGMLFNALRKVGSFRDPETILFGGLLYVSEAELIALAALAAVVAVALMASYNAMVLASFNRSLARSRRVPLRLMHYGFVVLLALVVNLCLKSVGALLINALLVVPAATAALLARNLRQLFWFSVGGCWLCGVCGLWASTRQLSLPGLPPLDLGPGGTIIVWAVAAFFLAMPARWLVGRLNAARSPSVSPIESPPT